MSGTLILISALALTGPQAKVAQAAPPNTAVIGNATVSVIDEAEVPAMDAGQIREMEAREGLEVKRGQFLASLNNEREESKISVAKAQLDISNAEAESDVRIEVAKMKAQTTYYIWQQAVHAIARLANSISQTDELQRKFSYLHSKSEIEQAELEQRIARLTADAREAELAAAQTDLAMRRIEAPIDGIVDEVKKNVGEWVTAGDVVLKLVRLDRLRVEGHLALDIAHPAQVSNQPARISVQINSRDIVELDGRISFVKPTLTGDRYHVWAEVANRKLNEEWLLRPGMKASITVDLKPVQVGGVDRDAPPITRRATQPNLTDPRMR
jgi:macrolide-specific efflux system membrane fusion protein